MDQCECVPLNRISHDKIVLVKTKQFNRRTVISIDQLFKVHEHMPSALAATDQWPCRRCRWRFA